MSIALVVSTCHISIRKLRDLVEYSLVIVHLHTAAGGSEPHAKFGFSKTELLLTVGTTIDQPSVADIFAPPESECLFISSRQPESMSLC